MASTGNTLPHALWLRLTLAHGVRRGTPHGPHHTFIYHGLHHVVHRGAPHRVFHAGVYSTVHPTEYLIDGLYHDVLTFVTVCLMVVKYPTGFSMKHAINKWSMIRARERQRKLYLDMYIVHSMAPGQVYPMNATTSIPQTTPLAGCRFCNSP